MQRKKRPCPWEIKREQLIITLVPWGLQQMERMTIERYWKVSKRIAALQEDRVRNHWHQATRLRQRVVC